MKNNFKCKAEKSGLGIYNHEDSCYENGCSASDDDECEELFQENDRTRVTKLTFRGGQESVMGCSITG